MEAIAQKNTDVIEVFVSKNSTCRDGRNMIGQDAFLLAVKGNSIDIAE